MAEDKKPAAKSKPIADVAHPDQTAAEPNSKPVIISNRPIMKDPMVVPEEGMTVNVAQSGPGLVAADSKAELKLPVSTESAAVDPSHEKPGGPAAPEEAPVKESTEEKEPEAEVEDGAKPDAQDETSDAEEVAAPKESIAEVQAAEDAEAAKQAEHDAAIEKLIDDEQYVLPINAVEKRRSKRFVLLGAVLSLVLAMAWVDVALDAGLIQLGGVKPVTHFFSN